MPTSHEGPDRAPAQFIADGLPEGIHRPVLPWARVPAGGGVLLAVTPIGYRHLAVPVDREPGKQMHRDVPQHRLWYGPERRQEVCT